MANLHTGEVKPWDQLSELEKNSGEWVPVTQEQAKELRAGGTRKEEVMRQLLAPIHPESGLSIDAKPQAHRRAIEAKRLAEGLSARETAITREIVGSETIPVLARAEIALAPGFVRSVDELEPGEMLQLMGGVASVQR